MSYETLCAALEREQLATAERERDEARAALASAERVVEAARAWASQGSRSKWTTRESRNLWDALRAHDAQARQALEGGK